MSCNFKYLDQKALLAHFQGDEEMIEELVEVFSQTYPELVHELEEALKTKDKELFERSAHTLKGMIANFFALEIQADYYALEQKGKEGNFEDTQTEIKDVTHKTQQLLKELEQFVEGQKK